MPPAPCPAAAPPARYAANLAQALGVRRAAEALHGALGRSGGRYSTRACHALLQFCTATIALVDDGDCRAQQGSLMDELSCDERGDPCDAFGMTPALFNPAWVHPDDPCQSKGIAA